MTHMRDIAGLIMKLYIPYAFQYINTYWGAYVIPLIFENRY